MIATLQEFEEHTAFERYALDQASLVGEPDKLSGSLDLRQPTPHVQVGVMTDMYAPAVAKFRSSLVPLLFGAAWKVLDLLLEFALAQAHPHFAGVELRINQKQARAIARAASSRSRRTLHSGKCLRICTTVQPSCGIPSSTVVSMSTPQPEPSMGPTELV